jgi:m7GpppX diphosphatase
MDLKTIRDLNGSHLELLKSIRDESYASIQKQYGLHKSQIKAFFHYYPTYYHLHVHFVHVKVFEKAGAVVGKAVPLEDVIENIEMFDSNYY